MRLTLAIAKDTVATVVEVAGMVVPTAARRFVCEHIRKHGHDPVIVNEHTALCRSCLCRADLDHEQLRWVAA